MPRQRKTDEFRELQPWVVMIRNLRTDHDLTQKEVAEEISVSQRVYADYELGNVRIPVDHLLRLSHYYNVTMDYICGNKDKRN